MRYLSACAVAHWRLAKMPEAPVEPLMAALRQIALVADRTNAIEASPMCITALEAMLAVRDGASDRLARVVTLDSLLRLGPPGFGGFNILVAQLFDRLGRTDDAYRAARRGDQYMPLLSAVRRVRGDLAERLGHREDAIEQYQLYLANRQNPEPALIPERDAVRAALARLLGEPGANPPLRPEQ
jgi:tetratricopeptide (TPR) repeat protein